MRHLLVAALLAAATCRQQSSPAPTPDPVPFPVPEPTATADDDAGPPPDLPEEPCGMAWATMADAECAPAEGHDAWLAACAKLPTEALRCVMTVDSCAEMRACLESVE